MTYLKDNSLFRARVGRAQSLVDSFSGGEGLGRRVSHVYEDSAPLTVGVTFEDGTTSPLTGEFARYVLRGDA